MADIAAIEQVAAQLRQASSFAAVFGVLPDTGVLQKKRVLRSQFTKLAFMVHPDHAPKDGAKKAAEAFEYLNELRQKAEVAIEEGTYTKPFGSMSAPSSNSGDYFEIRSSVQAYRLAKAPLAQGDFSVLYRGSGTKDPSGFVVAKIASAPADNVWLEREAQVLARFRDAKAGNPMLGVRKFVPELIDTFLIEGEKRTRFRVLVTRFVPGLVSVAEVIDAHPKGLEPIDAVWICRRIIAQVMAAEMAGAVHCALTPDHILIDPIAHEPLHIGWAHALDRPHETGSRITHVIDRYRDWYPPEVFDKKTPDVRTDLYMAGKTMIKLLGGDVKRNTLPSSVPDTVARVVRAAAEPSPARRPQSGRAYFDEFTRVVRAEWGTKYRPLMMPVRN